jgi:hypothetical protein
MPLPVTRLAPLMLTFTMLLAACGGDGDARDGDSSGAAVSASAATTDAAPPAGAVELTVGDVELYERGLQQEIELVRAAQTRGSGATTPEARSEAMQAQWKEQTMPAAARAIGADPARYAQVRERLHEVLRTLDFQGKIEGPMQLDTSRATPEMRARLASDPVAELPQPVGAALTARLDRLAPLFAQYVRLTAVGG